MSEEYTYKKQLERLKIVEEPLKGGDLPEVRFAKFFSEVTSSPTTYFGADKLVLMLVGCPCSGKTHFTSRLQRTIKRCVIQSRDFVRTSPTGEYKFDPAKEHKVHTKFYNQLRELYNNKSWDVIIVDDANCSKREVIELVTFLESLEANIQPIVFEAPPKLVLESRLARDTKGLVPEKVFKSAEGVINLSELLFEMYNPFIMRNSEIAFPGGTVPSEAAYNEEALDEENRLIFQIHKYILSFRPNDPSLPQLYSDFAMVPFKRAIFEVYRELEDEKDELYQQLTGPATPNKRSKKTSKDEEEKK